MTPFAGRTLSWSLADEAIELALHREPCNEIGSAMLDELEAFARALDAAAASGEARALIVHSTLASGFSAGADLRELYHRIQGMPVPERLGGVRAFLRRIHAVFDAIDGCPLTTVAAVHGVTFGGGFELALLCDVIVADRFARFCLPELRLGLIPAFGGIPRLKRDLGNGVVRDLLLTGRSINAQRARAVGLVAQLAAEGEALRLARSVAAQAAKFDRDAVAAAKRFAKRVPAEELAQEIEIFCRLFARPEAEAGLRRFVESTDAMPYLP